MGSWTGGRTGGLGAPGRGHAAGVALTVPPHAGTSVGARLLGELWTAALDLVAQSRASVGALRDASAWTLAAVALWTLGIVGDATTTLLMMGTGRFEEANGSAAALMGVVGVTGWVLLSSLVCVAIASLSLARPRTTYAWAAATMAVLVCLGKLHATAGNALLWWTVS